jgi:hypothetical protein
VFEDAHPCVGSIEEGDELLVAFAVALEAAMFEVDASGCGSFGDETDFDFAGFAGVGIELPVFLVVSGAEVPGEADAVRRIPCDDFSPVALFALGAAFVPAAADTRLDEDGLKGRGANVGWQATRFPSARRRQKRRGRCRRERGRFYERWLLPRTWAFLSPFTDCFLGAVVAGCFGDDLKGAHGLGPQLVEVGAQAGDAFRVELVEAAGPGASVGDEAGGFEDFEVLGDGRRVMGSLRASSWTAMGPAASFRKMAMRV